MMGTSPNQYFPYLPDVTGNVLGIPPLSGSTPVNLPYRAPTPARPNPYTGPPMGVTSSNWFKQLDPVVQASIIQALTGAAGAAASAYGQGQIAEADRAAQGAQSSAGVMGQNLNRQLSGMQTAAGMLGGPMDLQQARGKVGLQKEFLFGGPGGSTQWLKPKNPDIAKLMPDMPDFSGAAKYWSDDAMLASEQPYWQAAGALSRGQVRPNYGAVYGAAGNPWQTALDQSTKDYTQNLMRDEQSAVTRAMMDQQALKEALGQSPSKSTGQRGLTATGGALAGAKLGSMFAPGVGTAAGAGIGALLGWIA